MAKRNDTVEILQSELEGVLNFGAKLAKQNEMILTQDASTQAALQTLAESVAALSDLIHGLIQAEKSAKRRRYNLIRENGVITGIEEE